MSDQSIRPLLESCARIARLADPERELTAVAAKLYAAEARGAHFTALAGAPGWQAAAQILRDRKQWAAALGLPTESGLAAFGERMRRPVPAAAAPAPRLGDGGVLGDLPVARMATGDAAAQMVAVAIAADPVTGREALCLTRHHRVGAGRLSVIGLSPTLERLRQAWGARPMPLALAVGAAPAVILAAALGCWRDADFALAGGLAGEPIRTARVSGLPLPAEAELLIAGTLPPHEECAARLVSQFGAYAATRAPILEVGQIGQRAAPVFHAMQVGAPGELAGTLCLAAELLVAEHIRNIEGGIELLDIRCPESAAGQAVFVKLRPRVEGQAKTALIGALSGAVNGIKFAVAVDEDVEAADLREVFWSVASRTHAETDVAILAGMRAHPLDRSAGPEGAARWFIDATMPPLTQRQRREDFARAIPKNLAATELDAFLPKE